MKGKKERDEALKEMILKGISNEEMANVIGKSANVIHVRITRLLKSLGAKNRYLLMAKEIENLNKNLKDVQHERGVRSPAVIGLYNELAHLVFILEPMERASLIPADTLQGAKIALKRAKP